MAARRPAPEVCGVTVYDDLQPRRLGGQDHRHSRLVTGIRSFHVPAALAARHLGAGGDRSKHLGKALVRNGRVQRLRSNREQPLTLRDSRRKIRGSF